MKRTFNSLIVDSYFLLLKNFSFEGKKIQKFTHFFRPVWIDFHSLSIANCEGLRLLSTDTQRVYLHTQTLLHTFSKSYFHIVFYSFFLVILFLFHSLLFFRLKEAPFTHANGHCRCLCLTPQDNSNRLANQTLVIGVHRIEYRVGCF